MTETLWLDDHDRMHPEVTFSEATYRDWIANGVPRGQSHNAIFRSRFYSYLEECCGCTTPEKLNEEIVRIFSIERSDVPKEIQELRISKARWMVKRWHGYLEDQLTVDHIVALVSMRRTMNDRERHLLTQVLDSTHHCTRKGNIHWTPEYLARRMVGKKGDPSALVPEIALVTRLVQSNVPEHVFPLLNSDGKMDLEMFARFKSEVSQSRHCVQSET